MQNLKTIPYFDAWWETIKNGVVVDSNYTTIALLDDSAMFMTVEKAYQLASSSIPNCNQNRMFVSTFNSVVDAFWEAKGGYLAFEKQAIKNICGDLSFITGKIRVYERDAYGRIKVESWTDSDGDSASSVLFDTRTVNIGISSSILGDVIVNSNGLDSSPIEFWAKTAFSLSETQIENEMKNIILNINNSNTNSMQYINLTPHDITVQLPNGERVTYPKTDTVVRVSQISKVDTESLHTLPAMSIEYGEVSGLPYPEDGYTFIVSGLVLAAVKDRKDLVAPLTDGTAIRNEQGQIEAVTAWVVNN